MIDIKRIFSGLIFFFSYLFKIYYIKPQDPLTQKTTYQKNAQISIYEKSQKENIDKQISISTAAKSKIKSLITSRDKLKNKINMRESTTLKYLS
jgi:hypothetical protein